MKQILFIRKIAYYKPWKGIGTMMEIASSFAKSNVQSKIASAKAVSDDSNILSIIDKSLKHLNQISQANFIAQDLYIELLKQKKTMKFDQIKKIYFTLTESKAKEVLFERDKKELMQTDYQNHEGLVRLCWRSIEKLIKKITYYMINENHLSVISKNVLKLIQLNQSFVRRFQKLKNSSMLFIVQLMEKLIQENTILQKNIYDILLNRGYVVSLDEFYKLNGYDAQHRQAYYAKKGDDIVQIQSEDSQPEKQAQSQKQSGKNSRNQTLRKKKGFRIDPRYSWKQKILLQEKKQKEKNPSNKTNFQIRQSFEKLIGDFLQNQNLNEILVNYNFQEYTNIEKKEEKHTSRQNEISVIQKKIFQNKIGTVISQLKRNSIVKASSKLLEIINISSQQAIKSKVGYGQKSFLQRKNSGGTDGGIAQRKMRESMMNDRKIINENYFRELRRRNANMQNFMNQQIIIDTKRIQKELETLAFQSPKPNSKVIEFNKKRHNQNNPTNIKKSKFAEESTNEMFAFNPQNNTKDNTPNYKSKKSSFKYFETQFNWKDAMGTRRNIPDSKNGISLAEKIRIAKYEWQLKNERDILEEIQNSSIDPSNLTKLIEFLHELNRKKELKSKPFCETLKEIDQNIRTQGYITISKKDLKFQTYQTQADTELCIQNMTFKQSNKVDPSKICEGFYNMKRVKTEQSPTRAKQISNRSKRLIFQNWKQSKGPYEIYDRRLKRILRRL